LKEEALDRTLLRTRCGRVYGPAVRQTTEWTWNWDWTIRGSNPSMSKILFPLQNVQTGLRPTHPIEWVPWFFPVGKAAGAWKLPLTSV
jgi:hypothetical protein